MNGYMEPSIAESTCKLNLSALFTRSGASSRAPDKSGRRANERGSEMEERGGRSGVAEWILSGLTDI